MHIPAPFGFPVYKHVKRRLAKKILARRGRDLWARFLSFHNYSCHGLIRTCTGLNERIEKVEPSYIKVGRRGRVLLDLEFWTVNGGSCGFYSCGVELPITHEQCRAYIEDLIGYWSTHGDEWGFVKRYSSLTLHGDGTFEWGKET